MIHQILWNCSPIHTVLSTGPSLCHDQLVRKLTEPCTPCDVSVLLCLGQQRSLALGALWVQPMLEDRSNLAFCLVNFVLQLLLLTPDVACIMEGAFLVSICRKARQFC